MEFVNCAGEIYDETINFLTRLSARYARLVAEPIAKLAGEVEDHAEKANSIYRMISGGASARPTSWRRGPPSWRWIPGSPSVTGS